MEQTKSQRVAYGSTLVALGAEIPEIVVLEADLGKSTMSRMFGDQYPDRYYDVGIAEANMAGIAAGLSLTGKIPFFSSFAAFSTGRCYEQIRTSICLPSLNVKICGSSAGLSDYGDGSTHQTIDDVALMRLLPNMQVFTPADAVETAQIVRYMATHRGPMYIRINRNDLPIYTAPDEPFDPSAIRVLREGSDAIVFASGVMLGKAMEAADLLATKGISLRVAGVTTLKPLNQDAVCSMSAGMPVIITAEEHSVNGGLGDAISDALSLQVPAQVRRIGIRDSFGTSAENYAVLLEKYNLTAEAIADAVLRAR